MAPSRNIDVLLSKIGSAYTYVTPNRIAESEVLMLNRDTASLLTDDELKLALSKGLLLNSGAAQVIEQRGFGQYLGAKICDKICAITSSEELLTLKRTDGAKVIIPSRVNGNAWKEIKLNSAEALSKLIIPSGKTFPGITKYQNELGGKIIVFAAEEDFGNGFYTKHRIKLLRDLVSELSASAVVAEFKAYGSLVHLTKLEEDYLLPTCRQMQKII